MRTIIALVLMCCSWSTLAQCKPHSDLGTPLTGGSHNALICQEGFYLSFNYDTKQPDWAVYKVTKESAALSCDSQPDFRPNPDVNKDFQLGNEAYKNNIWDKGHVAERATVDISCKAETESVYYTNAALQHAMLNRVGWRILEERTRELADKLDGTPMWVLSGVIQEGKVTERGYALPSYWYKVIYIPKDEAAIAFVFPNAPLSANKIPDGLMTVGLFERTYGIKTFDGMSPKSLSEINPIFNTLYNPALE